MKSIRLLESGTVGYCCTPDLRDPKTLLNHAVLAEKAGFRAVWASDHFHPWFHTSANEAHTWIWMTAALERVRNIPLGTAITSPVLRYHPALIAQAFATMEAIHGRRIILGVGTGEAMNEVPLGYSWPSLKERRERLVEAVKVIRRLWSEEFVDFRGKHYLLKGANLYMKANVPIFIAGFGPKMAKIAGMLGDGFISALRPFEYFRNTIFPAIEEGAKSVEKAPADVTKVMEIDVSYDEDFERALSSVRCWAPTLLSETFLESIADPRELEELGRKKVTDKELAEAYLIGTSPEDHIKRIEEAFRTGFDHVYVFSSSPNEEKAVEMYRKNVLPYFHSKRKD